MKFFGNTVDKLCEKRLGITEFVSTVMILIIAAMPGMMIFSPSSYGKVFKIFGVMEIAVLLCVAVFNIILICIDKEKAIADFGVKRFIAGIKKTFSANRHFVLLLTAYIIAFVSVCMAVDSKRAFWGTDFRVDGFFMYTVFFAVFVFGSCINDPRMKKTIYGMYIFSFFLNGIIVLQQYLGVIGSANEELCPQWLEFLKNIYEQCNIRTGVYYKGITGGFYNSNHAGYFLMMCTVIISVIFIISDKKWIEIVFGMMCAFSEWLLIINNTFGCYISSLICFAFVALICVMKPGKGVSRMKAIAPLAIMLILSVCVNVAGNNTALTNITTLKNDVEKIANDTSDSQKAGSGRWGLWIETVDMIEEKPIIGFGPDNVNNEYKSRDMKMTRAHNEYLEHPLNCGIPFAVFYLSGVFFIIFRRIRHMKSHEDIRKYLIPLAVCISYMLSAFVGVFLFYTACHFFVMLSLLKD